MKKIKYGEQARESLKKGSNKINKIVGSTLGPNGKTVILHVNGVPIITKDGVSVAKEVELEDPFENVACQMIKQVSLNTNKEVGDGTTTATVLANAILEQGFIEIKKGVSPIKIKKELDNNLKTILEKLNSYSIDVKNDYNKLLSVAKISTNNDIELANLIIDLIKQTNNSKILLEPSSTSKTYTDYVKGMSFDSSYVDSYFITDKEKRTVSFDNAYILIYDGKIKQSKELLKLLEKIKFLKRPIVIIAEQVTQDIILTMLRNRNSNGIESVILNAPGFGPGRKQALDDIALYTGGNVVREGQLQHISTDDLGEVKSIMVTDEKTTIKEGNGNKDKINERITNLETVKDKYNDFDKSKIEERISKFKGGIGIIYIGASSELEYKEKYDRIEDAVNAVNAAIEEGVISGGGTTLYKISENKNGILYKAIKSPYLKIKENQDITDFNPSEDYKQFLDDNILDPKKVTRVALENAVSVAGTILTTDNIIINE